MLRISAESLSNFRTAAFAVGGLICTAYVAAALINPLDPYVPDWLPVLTAGLIAILFFLAALLAGERNTEASLDESYKSDQKTAASYGFWAALAVGTGLWTLDRGNGLQLGITLVAASAVFFLTHVVLEIRGRK